MALMASPHHSSSNFGSAFGLRLNSNLSYTKAMSCGIDSCFLCVACCEHYKKASFNAMIHLFKIDNETYKPTDFQHQY